MFTKPLPISPKGTRMSNSRTEASQRSVSPVLRRAIIGYIVLTGSVCYVAVLEGLRWAPPFAFAGARTMLGGLALLLTAGLVRQPIIPARPFWKWLPVVAVTATGITFGAMFLSPRFAGAGLPAILGNAQPLFIIAIAWIFLSERLSRARGISLAVGWNRLRPLWPAVSAGDFSVSVGALLALLTSLGAAIGTVLVRWLRPGPSLFALTAWQLILGGALLFAVFALQGEAPVQWSGPFVGILIFLGIFNSAAFTLGWFWLLQFEEAGRLAIYLFLVPVFGILWAWVFRGEIPSVPLMVGSAFILLGIFLNDSAGFRRWLRSRN